MIVDWHLIDEIFAVYVALELGDAIAFAAAT